MLFEQALNEQDDYQRLTKIIQGCKYISQSLPFVQNFAETHILKLLFLCYPFSQDTIDMLITIMIERFRNQEFLDSLYNALTEVGSLNEVLYAISKSKEIQQHISKRHSKKTLITQNLNIVESKQYALKCLYYMFELMSELDLKLESRAIIFIVYLRNTSQEDLQAQIMDSFQECKSQIFGSSTWVRKVEDQIEQVLYVKKPESTFMGEIAVDRGNSSVSSDPSEELEENKINVMEQIELWIMREKIGSIQEGIEYFRNPDYLKLMESFIFDVTYQELHPKWSEMYSDLEDIGDQSNWKLGQKRVDKLYILRSYKMIMFIMNKQNYGIICRNVNHYHHKLFTLIYYFLIDSDRIGCLTHIAQLIDFLLIQSPRASIYEILDHNLLFSLSYFMYNQYIFNIIEKILNIAVDEYSLGNVVQEQIWMYIQKTQWIQFLQQVCLYQEIESFKMDKNYKTEHIINILAVLQAQAKLDRLSPLISTDSIQKEKLTELLGALEPGKTPMDFYGNMNSNWSNYLDHHEYVSTNEFKFRDIDNFMDFIEKRKDNDQELRQSSRNLRKSVRKLPSISLVQTSTVKQKQQELPKLNVSHVVVTPSKWIQPTSTTSISTRRKGNTSERVPLSTNSTQNRIRTEDSTYSQRDRFNSSKLRTLYPSYKIKICGSEFERQKSQFKIKEQQIYHFINLFSIIIDSAINQIENEAYLNKILNKTTINCDFIFKILINKELIYFYFQLYLYYIDTHIQLIDSFAQISAKLINQLFRKCLVLQQIYQYKELFKDVFREVVDLLAKTVIKIESYNYSKYSYSSYSKLLVNDTFILGFDLFNHQELIEPYKYVFQSFNETYLHIMLLWFFDSTKKQPFLYQFTRIMIIIFTKAPQALLASILFKLGFPTTLYNARSNFIQNNIKDLKKEEQFFLFLTLQIYIIDYCLKKRGLTILYQSLSQLESWKALLQSMPNPHTPIINDITKLINQLDPDQPQTKQSLTKQIFKLRSYKFLEFESDAASKKASKRNSVQAPKLSLKTIARLAIPMKKKIQE